jgi:hypothetical protein
LFESLLIAKANKEEEGLKTEEKGVFDSDLLFIVVRDGSW